MRSATQKKNHVHDFEYGIINLNNDSDAGLIGRHITREDLKPYISIISVI